LFATLPLLPADPILDLGRLFDADPRPEKVNLGIGVYLDDTAHTPIMRAVAEAETIVRRRENSKAYLPPKGAPGYAEGIERIALGSDIAAVAEGRCAIVQTPGGCGALGIAGALMKRSGVECVVMGTPTWSNHKPVFGAAGLATRMIPYYDADTGGIDFAGFIAEVKTLGPKDVLLIHGACHNPTGADLSHEQIDELIDIALDRGFLPMIDSAYHGLGESLDTDGYVLRAFASRLPELLISYSCSKNFGLYRERTGAIIMIGKDADHAAILQSHALDIARQTYSMPPAHGALMVSEILASDELEAMWRSELAEMQSAIRARRRLFADALAHTPLGNSLAWVGDHNGMFSLLPMTPEQTRRMRDEFAIHMAASGRINVCGIRADNAERLARAVAQILSSEPVMQSA